MNKNYKITFDNCGLIDIIFSCDSFYMKFELNRKYYVNDIINLFKENDSLRYYLDEYSFGYFSTNFWRNVTNFPRKNFKITELEIPFIQFPEED